MTSNNNQTYMSFTGAGHVIGTYNGWAHSGNYMYLSPNTSEYKTMCYGMLPRLGDPAVESFTSHYSLAKCPTGFVQFNIDNLRRANGSQAYMYKLGHALVMGGLEGIGISDNTDGWHYHYWTSYQKKLCMRVHNAVWPN